MSDDAKTPEEMARIDREYEEKLRQLRAAEQAARRGVSAEAVLAEWAAEDAGQAHLQRLAMRPAGGALADKVREALGPVASEPFPDQGAILAAQAARHEALVRKGQAEDAVAALERSRREQEQRIAAEIEEAKRLEAEGRVRGPGGPLHDEYTITSEMRGETIHYAEPGRKTDMMFFWTREYRIDVSNMRYWFYLASRASVAMTRAERRAVTERVVAWAARAQGVKLIVEGADW